MSEIFFQQKAMFTLNGFSMYDVLITQESFRKEERLTYSISTILPEELGERWRHPLIHYIKNKIDNDYGIKVKGILMSHFEGEDYFPFYKDSYKEGTGVFLVSIGGTRMLSFESPNGSCNDIQLDDGDLFYFNNEYGKNKNYTINPLDENAQPCILIMIFV